MQVQDTLITIIDHNPFEAVRVIEVFSQILQITLLIADYMNMIGKTTAAAGSSESEPSRLFLNASSSVTPSPKLASKLQ